MRLLHNNLADILIQNIQDSNNTFKGELNKSLAKLLENDIDMTPGKDNIPDIWKCSWYNQFDKTVISSKYGYSRGQAVWLNTEDLTEFIYAKWNEIESIVESNPTLSYSYKKIKDDKAKAFDFFKKVVLGDISGAVNKEPLYCIGEISSQIQLRVSLTDHNIALPTDDIYWKDFFEYDICADNKAEVSAYVDDQLSTQIEQHMKDYHMLGIDDDQLKNLTADLEANFVKADLKTNLSSINQQHFLSHRSSSFNMEGFDFVKEFKYKLGNTGSVKWYKYWNSGYLEQGGIIFSNDMLGDVADSKFLTVLLPIKYDYVKQRIEKFYAVTYIDERTKLDDTNCLAADSRYNVHVTQLKQVDDVPYSHMCTANCYETNATACIKNESFQIQLTPNHNKYSFYTSGFIKAESLDNMRQLDF